MFTESDLRRIASKALSYDREDQLAAGGAVWYLRYGQDAPRGFVARILGTESTTERSCRLSLAAAIDAGTIDLYVAEALAELNEWARGDARECGREYVGHHRGDDGADVWDDPWRSVLDVQPEPAV